MWVSGEGGGQTTHHQLGDQTLVFALSISCSLQSLIASLPPEARQNAPRFEPCEHDLCNKSNRCQPSAKLQNDWQPLALRPDDGLRSSLCRSDPKVSGWLTNCWRFHKNGATKQSNSSHNFNFILIGLTSLTQRRDTITIPIHSSYDPIPFTMRHETNDTSYDTTHSDV